ncbi:MAG: FecCD family ABC transporter permease [Pseudolabrys sp.]
MFLVVLLGAAVVISICIGAAGIPVSRLPAALGIAAAHGDPAVAARDELVLWSIRLPRIVIAILIGALLAVSGTMMQGLFRNPLADPALVGVSSGGAFAAAAAIVIGDKLLATSTVTIPFGLLTAAAFCGSLVTTLILYRIATRESRTSVAIFLLGGLAIGAVANAGLGMLVFIADDRQLRDITFWMLGSLSGATWPKVATLAPFLAAMLLAMPFVSRGLDLLVLGESDAFHSGVAVERLKRICIVLVSAMVGAAVSFAGVIGFVGIVVPHLLRLVIGPSHAMLLLTSTLLGAALLLIADSFARTIVAPAEMPIGILTALIGSPFFLFLLLRQRGLVGL